MRCTTLYCMLRTSPSRLLRNTRRRHTTDVEYGERRAAQMTPVRARLRFLLYFLQQFWPSFIKHGYNMTLCKKDVSYFSIRLMG